MANYTSVSHYEIVSTKKLKNIIPKMLYERRWLSNSTFGHRANNRVLEFFNEPELSVKEIMAIKL